MPDQLEDAGYASLLRMMYDVHDGQIPPSQAVRTMLYAHQAQAMVLDSSYPTDYYMDSDVWKRLHAQASSNHTGYSGMFDYDHLRRLSTTVPSRSGTVKMLALILAQHVGEHPRIVDGGCGENTGNRQLVLNGQFPYATVEVVDRIDGRGAGLPRQTDLFNDILARPFEPESVTGIDEIDPTEGVTQLWLRACAWPEEVASSEWQAGRDALLRAEVSDDRLRFVRANLASASEMAAVRESLGPVDLATSSMAWYLGGPEERRAKFTNLTDLARFTVFLECAWPTKKYLRPMGPWRAMNAFVYDREEQLMHHVLTYEMARPIDRPRRVVAHEALGDLAVGGPYEEQVKELVS
jgi:hypothetical protein